MGDVLSLIEEVEQKVDRKKAEKLVKKVQKGKKFDLEDLRDQLQQMQNMGGLGSMLEKLPGMGNVSQMMEQANAGQQFGKMEALINSMTPAERRNPDILNGSRKRRITVGSGTTIQDLNRLIKQHKQMAKMMKKMKGGGMAQDDARHGWYARHGQYGRWHAANGRYKWRWSAADGWNAPRWWAAI